MMEMKTVVRRERAKNKSEGRNIDENKTEEVRRWRKMQEELSMCTF